MRCLSKRIHDPLGFHGRVEMLVHESEALANNPLGDPSLRELPVYLPPGEAAPKALPVLFLLAGFTGRGQGFLGTDPWFPGVVQRYDRLINAGEAPAVILALPDCFTQLGGSQYLNSSATGNYRDYVIEELLPLVDAEYGTGAGGRGVLGKSSGGFGALRLGMREAGKFQALGAISADCGFENTLGAEFLHCLRGLIPYEMNVLRFLKEFKASPMLDGDGHAIINVLAMAACYSPNPDSPMGFDLPFDLHTGVRDQEVWAKWLSFDPARAAANHAQTLAALEYLHIECGTRDEFNLQWGNRQLSQLLEQLGVPHVYEEHAGGHRGIDERYLRLIPKLARALGTGCST